MCDCYDHPCEVCGETVPMHIGDYKYPREDFRVWCREHVDRAPAGAVVFSAVEWIDFECAILGPEVGEGGDNSPNVAMPLLERTVLSNDTGRERD